MKPDSINAYFQSLSPQDFALWGVKQLAYIKPVAQGKDTENIHYALHGADGRLLTVEDDISHILQTAHTHSLRPLRLQ